MISKNRNGIGMAKTKKTYKAKGVEKLFHKEIQKSQEMKQLLELIRNTLLEYDIEKDFTVTVSLCE